MSVNYGSAEYWDNRYSEESEHPFDWLFDYGDVVRIIHKLIPDQNTKILVVGCGNAPFSSDLYSDGYIDVVNTDLSPIVINQQRSRFPEQKWEIMDVMNMKFQDNEFQRVIDKSLIDTLLCCTDSANQTFQMLREIHRVAGSGSRFITFSLHSLEEVKEKYQNTTFPDWKCYFFRVKSNRWNSKQNRKRAVAHTMIVCDKSFRDGNYPPSPELNDVKEILSEADLIHFSSYASDIIFDAALRHCDENYLLFSIDKALYSNLSQ